MSSTYKKNDSNCHPNQLFLTHAGKKVLTKLLRLFFIHPDYEVILYLSMFVIQVMPFEEIKSMLSAYHARDHESCPPMNAGMLFGLFSVLVMSCGSDSPVRNEENLSVKQALVSPCGGFQQTSGTSRKSSGDDIEKVSWTFDAEPGTLTLVHSHVNLNCCGERSVSMRREDGFVVVEEDDQAGEPGRCRCMCFIDFSITIGGITSVKLPVRLVLTVDSTAVIKWEGTLDLTAGSGEITDLETQ